MLDYNKPIFAKPVDLLNRGSKNLYALLPMIEPMKYKIIGYNWFDLSTGKWNSCHTWATKQEAVKAYPGHEIFNGKHNVIGGDE